MFKNIKITLLVINNYEIGSFITLKKKYNFVKISVINNQKSGIFVLMYYNKSV